MGILNRNKCQQTLGNKDNKDIFDINQYCDEIEKLNNIIKSNNICKYIY